MHDKWMKEWFSKLRIYYLVICQNILHSYLSVLKLQNYSSQCNSCAFFRKIEENLSWVIEAINEASATNSIMNLSHTLFVIGDAKARCSILYSSGNIQIKYSWGRADPLPPHLSYIKLAKTSVSRGLKKLTWFICFYTCLNFISVSRLYHDFRGKVVLKTKRQKILWFPYSKNCKAKTAKVKVTKIGVPENNCS